MGLISVISYPSVESLDLERIKWKIVSKHPTIDSEGIDTVEREYKRFLTLKIIYPEQRLTPTRNMDLMWHTHILDTANYRRDCDELFGKFLNHRPYFGPYSSNGIYEGMQHSLEKLHQLYHEAFGEYPAPDIDEVKGEKSQAYCDGHHDNEVCDDDDDG